MSGEKTKLEADAARYQWIRQQVKTKAGLVDAQAMLWNAAPERKRLDRLIDEAMLLTEEK